MRAVVPADWYLSKVSRDRASGELWLTDAELPRLQVKWLDATRQKSVDTKTTLERYLEGLQQAAKKRRQPFALDRDVQVVGKAGRDISSVEGYRFTSEIEAYGVIWYSPSAERVTMAQVNGALGEPGFKTLARQVLASLHDAPQGERELWTAYDLECWIPAGFELVNQAVETGRTELKFSRGKETLTVGRVGLAAIALQRAGDLGDWAHQQHYKEWITFDLERTAATHHDCPAVDFRGGKKGLTERFRRGAYGFFKQPYPFALSARVWHCEAANCLFLVEHLRDAGAEDLLDEVCEPIPCQPVLYDSPKEA